METEIKNYQTNIEIMAMRSIQCNLAMLSTNGCITDSEWEEISENLRKIIRKNVEKLIASGVIKTYED